MTYSLRYYRRDTAPKAFHDCRQGVKYSCFVLYHGVLNRSQSHTLHRPSCYASRAASWEVADIRNTSTSSALAFLETTTVSFRQEMRSSGVIIAICGYSCRVLYGQASHRAL